LSRISDHSNETLVRRCCEGDEAAWATLVERYENLVYSVALHCGLDEDEAGDVFQQVWMELHRSLARLRNPEALPRWLMVSTRRLCYKQAARSARTARGVSEEMIDPAALPDQEVAAFEDRRRLEAALDRLPSTHALLLRLLFFSDEKISYEEISARTGLAVGSIGPIRARCLARLRRMLEELS